MTSNFKEEPQYTSLTTSRIEALSDAVFAIAMTLLVLGVALPPGFSREDFTPALISLWPNIAAYIVSFLVLAVYWIGHHNQFFWIERVNRTFLWINMFFLMSIAFIPFSSSLVANYPNEIFAIIIYGINAIIAGIILFIHWRYASRGGKLLVKDMNPHIVKVTSFRIGVGIVFYVISIVCSYVSTRLSLGLFAVVPFLYMIPSRFDTYFIHDEK